MDEQAQHDTPADRTVEVPLAPLMTQIADGVEEHIAESARLDIARARSTFVTQPGAEALAQLTVRLQQHCTTLAPFIERMPDGERPQRGTAALETWTRLRDNGPGDGPLANHSYARHLAYAACDMLDALSEHRRAPQPARFVGHTELPPVRTNAP